MFDKILRAGEGKILRKLEAIKDAVNSLESEFTSLTDDELRALTDEYRKRYEGGESLDDLMPEAFATVREASRRTLGQRHYDVQIMGGAALHLGNIAEMRTGEGKTLVATLPSYLNAISGKGVHVVTVNDYLAERDSEWMGRVHRFLGLTVGVILSNMTPAERRVAYDADITYGTNNEFGFDYLRDNMKSDLREMNQRGHNYAIVDEVDSILIDEARTPLIISGPSQDRSELYKQVDKVIPEVLEEHFTKDEKQRNVTFTEEGNEFMERRLEEVGILPAGQSLYDPESTTIVHHVSQALRAHKLFTKDKDYIVRDGEIVQIGRPSDVYERPRSRFVADFVGFDLDSVCEQSDLRHLPK